MRLIIELVFCRDVMGMCDIGFRHQIKAAEKTKFQATQLNATPTNTYKPVSGHSEHVSCLHLVKSHTNV